MGRQKSEPFWQHHVEAWRASDLTQEQYGRRHGLSATALAKWSSRLQREARAKRRQALVPVRVVGELAPASAMVVQHGAWRLTVPVGTDPSWVAALLRELVAC